MIDRVVSNAPTTLNTVLIHPEAYRVFQFKNYSFVSKSKNEYIAIILYALRVAIDSDRFKQYSDFTKIGFFSVLRKFIPWLDQQEITITNCRNLLNIYHTYRVNEEGVKHSSSGVNLILILLFGDGAGVNLPETHNQYLDQLRQHTKPAAPSSAEQGSITSWFEKISWLDQEVSSSDLLKISRPSEITPSFTICIATLLLHIIETKNRAKERLENFVNEYNTIQLQSTNIIKRDRVVKRDQYQQRRLERGKYLFDLASILITSESYPGSEKIKELFYWDCVNIEHRSRLMSVLEKYRISRVSNSIGEKLMHLPNTFSEDAWNFPSVLEQILFSYLCAWQTIQPYDIPKLKKSNFEISRNERGQPVAIQCGYYKGRSAREHHPFLIDPKQIEGKAIMAYLKCIPADSDNLFKSQVESLVCLTFGKNSISERIAQAFQLETISQEIKKNCMLRKKSNVFQTLFLVLYKFRDFSYSKWLNENKSKGSKTSSQREYRNEVLNWLPQHLPPLSSIKNSSVHSRSDSFRRNDPVNFNSHSSTTEERQYLTDSNKEWSNRSGKITRAVMDDISNFVYKPNLDVSTKKAHQLNLRTQIVSFGGCNMPGDKVILDSLGRIKPNQFALFDIQENEYSIVVLDTADTVLVMLHYIDQVRVNQRLLALHCLDFFERQALPTTEWMETVLTTRLSPSSVKKGKKLYKELCPILPPLFENEIRSGGM